MTIRDDSNIIEFEKKGYVSPDGNSNTIKKLRSRYSEHFKIFNSSMFNGRNPKYSSEQMFGKRLLYYYDIRKEKEFVDFLVKILFDKNSSPNRGMRTAFTRILHHHNLCWSGCYHGGKKIKEL